jgi:hypothetical protein
VGGEAEWLSYPTTAGLRKDTGHAVSRVECIFALFCYWYTCFTSHPCPTTVRSALNHESLNTTHSPALIRVVVAQPASAIIATNIMVLIMVFILVPSPCSFRLGFKDAPASVAIAVSRRKGSAKSDMVTGRRISRIASTIQGSAMTHLRYRVGEEELTSGVQGFIGRRRLSGNIECSLCCEAGYQLWERILLRRPFHVGCPTGSPHQETGTSERITC